jgi:hypothetical protein
MIRSEILTEEPKLPPEGFDPLKADAAELGNYWLPPRPDPTLQPELFAHWEEMFSPPPTFVRSQSVPRTRPVPSQSVPRTDPDVSNMPDAPRLWAGAGRLEDSRNWSGAYLDSNASPFCRVVGAWTIPTVRPGVPPQEDPRLPFQFSMWIGLDGKKQWTKSMPQVGSEHGVDRVDPRGQWHFLWWQWWQRRDGQGPELPYIIEGVRVKPGNRVLCSLTVMSPECVRIHVINRTTGHFATVQLKGDEPVRGGTAQWVVERQSDFRVSADVLHPLPDFTEVTFDRCDVDNGPMVSSPPWVPRYIQMTRIMRPPDGQPHLAIISRPPMSEKARTVTLVYQTPHSTRATNSTLPTSTTKTTASQQN